HIVAGTVRQVDRRSTDDLLQVDLEVAAAVGGIGDGFAVVRERALPVVTGILGQWRERRIRPSGRRRGSRSQNDERRARQRHDREQRARRDESAVRTGPPLTGGGRRTLSRESERETQIAR